MLDALSRFHGLPHRMNPIAQANDVLFVDDSKGTTVAATEAALAGIGRPTILIAGGDGKGQSFAPLKSAIAQSCRAVLLIGRDADLIARAVVSSGVDVELVGTLEAAVARAFELAHTGDAVLLSPACASLDQFRDYVERGERFASLVQARLKEVLHA